MGSLIDRETVLCRRPSQTVFSVSASIRESLGNQPSIPEEPNIEDGLLTVSDLMLDLRGVGPFGVR